MIQLISAPALVRTEPRILLPVARHEWREPSAAQPKDQFGNPGVQHRFRIMGKLHDGHTKFRLWLDDRDDFDQFLWSLAEFITSGTPIPREDWHLVNEIWGDPDLYRDMLYAVDQVDFLTTTGSNQTYPKPTGWGAVNHIEGLGGGGGGGVAATATRRVTGGGGGEYSKIVNFVFSGSSLTYRVGSAGSGKTVGSGGGPTVGDPGTVTYFNDTVDPGTGTDNTKLGAKPGGGGGAVSDLSSINGGASGTGGWGSTKNAGGRGGNNTGTATSSASGAGGAAGLNGAGNNGVDITGTDAASPGGSGDAGFGGSAGGSGSGAEAGNGTEWDASHGSGGGGGGGSTQSHHGGNYGGGGGSTRNSGGATSGNGSQGLIVVTYTPPTAMPIFRKPLRFYRRAA